MREERSEDVHATEQDAHDEHARHHERGDEDPSTPSSVHDLLRDEQLRPPISFIGEVRYCPLRPDADAEAVQHTFRNQPIVVLPTDVGDERHPEDPGRDGAELLIRKPHEEVVAKAFDLLLARPLEEGADLSGPEPRDGVRPVLPETELPRMPMRMRSDGTDLHHSRHRRGGRAESPRQRSRLPALVSRTTVRSHRWSPSMTCCGMYCSTK